jgi:branched-chain amino acid transport system substrate-binding protein
MMGISTRRAGRGIAVLAALAMGALTACAPASDAEKNADSANGGDTGDVVKVGFLSPVTGNVAAAGQEMREGWELYWEQHGDKVGDVTVETVFEDDAGNPDTALTKAKRLIEDEKVEVMVGPLLANTALAVSDYVTGEGIPSLQPVTAADDLTQRKQNPLMLRAGSLTGSQMNFPAGQWASDQGHRKAVTLCPDYAFGWESCAGFARAFTDAGGTVVKQLWFPLGTQDFSTYVTQLGNVGADIAFVAAAGGADGPRFIGSYNDFGLKGKLPLVTNCCLVDQSTLREVGPEAEGLNSVSYYAEGREGSAALDKFIDGYKEKYGKIPSLNVAGAYITAEVFAKALEATGGDAGGEALIAAARDVVFEDSLYGPMKYDEMNNPVANIYVREVKKNGDGDYVNVPVETFDAVSQFWNYEKDEYLADPPYDRKNTGQ